MSWSIFERLIALFTVKKEVAILLKDDTPKSVNNNILKNTNLTLKQSEIQ